MGELDIAVGIGKFRAAPEITCGEQAGGMESSEINNVPATTSGEISDGVREIGEVLACVAEGVGT